MYILPPMDHQIYININLSNERFISLFNNRTGVEQNQYIINYIYNYNDFLSSRIISSQEKVLTTFTEQELMIPEDAVCGISFEIPNCQTSCGHHFCRAEITRWLEQQKNEIKKLSCPTCRTEITAVFVAKNK